MIRAFVLAFGQLLDARIVKIVLLSVVLTLAVYAALIGGLIAVLSHLTLAQTPWLDSLARWGSGFSAVLLAALLFPAAVTVAISLWEDAIADAVEARHYPGLPPARVIPLTETLLRGLRLLAVTIVLNLALLPIYLALLFVPPMNAIVFAGINGLLLGRTYVEGVAARRLAPAAVRALVRQNRGRMWLAGTGAAFVLSIPAVNLVAPVVAMAAFVHLVHAWTAGTPETA